MITDERLGKSNKDWRLATSLLKKFLPEERSYMPHNKLEVLRE